MAKINELREKRAKIWEQAKAFLDSNRIVRVKQAQLLKSTTKHSGIR